MTVDFLPFSRLPQPLKSCRPQRNFSQPTAGAPATSAVSAVSTAAMQGADEKRIFSEWEGVVAVAAADRRLSATVLSRLCT